MNKYLHTVASVGFLFTLNSKMIFVPKVSGDQLIGNLFAATDCVCSLNVILSKFRISYNCLPISVAHITRRGSVRVSCCVNCIYWN